MMLNTGARGVSFRFSHKKGGVGKIKGLLKNGGVPYHLFPYYEPFPVLYFSESIVVCVLVIYTMSLSLLFVFHGQNLFLLNLINRYVTSAKL